MSYKIIAKVLNKEILIPTDGRTRSKHRRKVRIMNNNTNEYKYSFFPRIIFEWNCVKSIS